MDLRETGRAATLDLLALVWPTACVACGAPDRDCCDACLEGLRQPRPVRRVPLPFPCFAADVYDGALRALLVGCKHEGRVGFARHLGSVLAAPLAAALAEARGEAAPILVSAPSRPARVRERRYRHVDLVLSAALRGSRAPVLRARALRAVAGRTGQVGLGASARLENARRVAVRGSALRVLRGREVVLVDDVVTTGATLTAAAEALESAGARVVSAAVLCEAVRRDRAPLNGRDAPEPIRVETGSPKAIEYVERRDGAPQRPPA